MTIRFADFVGFIRRSSACSSTAGRHALSGDRAGCRRSPCRGVVATLTVPSPLVAPIDGHYRGPLADDDVPCGVAEAATSMVGRGGLPWPGASL